MMKRIGVVVGHSKTDPGAINANGRCEFDYNSELSDLVASELIDLGYEPVVIWRDRAYSQMPSKVNNVNIDFSVELHCNAFNTKATGSETLFWCMSTNGKRLAEAIHRNIVSVLGLTDRGTKGKVASDRGALMLRKTHKPHVILEPFFIDNPSDLIVGEERMEELAAAIAKGCDEYAR